jgi:steroid 5-alpha reductase family enzyme
MPAGRKRAFAWVALAYAVAVAAALAAGWACQWALTTNPLVVAGVADAAATLVVFAFSLALRNSSFYDAYWSVAPPLLILYWLLETGSGSSPFSWLLLGLVCVWSVRLTWNWAHGWMGLEHEDWRYRDLQARLGPWYWLVSFTGIHLMPTVLVFLGCVPVLLLLERDPGGLHAGVAALALLVGVAAVALEARADMELHQFRARRESPEQVLSTGVWGWCRHPNYVGELGFWLALGLSAAAAGVSLLAAGVGILAMLGLFVGVSIPMLEKRLLAAKPGYAEYRRSLYALLPVGSRWRRR